MVLERAEMLIKDGMEDEFAALLGGKVKPFLLGTPGVASVDWGRGVENPDKFLLLVEWQDMSDHEAFKAMPSFGDFRAMLMPYSKGGAMEHFSMS